MGDVRRALICLPEDISETYTRILAKIFNDRIESRRKIAECAPLWVFGAARPLTSRELVAAIQIQLYPEAPASSDEGEYPIQAIIDVCCNLLTQENDTIRFFHYSVHEFITAENSPDGSSAAPLRRFWETIHFAHERIAEA